ncbi:hypothetical protein BDW02DRAFT_58968 [Decorospora gaudefroyi]|uniref:Uncharacterized protein n=1 Tax=Decorospora gaudefroyi TaxID=184978 RepID=A0A6A5KD33_9PLEO|nr:hypothetical protein BDW02DRAFT_58968 [Decorospora gaudefroyi]
MVATLRMDPLDFDVPQDDELPGYYEAARAPAYDSSAYGPLATFRLRQYDRKIQVLGAHGAPAASSYRIITNNFRIFSKKPEMEVLYTSPDMRQRMIASIDFDNNGGYPWRPRAHYDHTAEDGLTTRYKMESVNFEDWTLTTGDSTYVWRLDMRPISLIVCEKNSAMVVARFTYAERGMLALRGADVGELTIYHDRLTLARDGIDKVICGTIVVMTFQKKMGRNYTNRDWPNRLERVGSVTTEVSLPSLRRASIAGYSTVGN